MFKKIMNEISIFKRDRYFYEKILRNQLEIGFQNILLGANKYYPPRLKGYSQGEEDFILYAISRILNLKTFLEFGVEDWRESNTRIISSLINGKFCLIDGDKTNIQKIKQSREYYCSNIMAISSWITVENINGLIDDASTELGSFFDVISIDLDGNDYWILKELTARPKVFIVEYNSLFGREKKISTKYNPEFARFNFDPSGCIYGASFVALEKLLDERGYRLFHVSEMGNNLIFIQEEFYDSVAHIFLGCVEFREISYREMHVSGIRSFMNYDKAQNYVLSDKSKYIELE
ncbi:hypothetical protein N9736_01165 [Amylibacter sp.]|nr:hypothetical protein [Amylibacter sp.]MDC1414104.1 hypothetical protein [Amylibacter sp.]